MQAHSFDLALLPFLSKLLIMLSLFTSQRSDSQMKKTLKLSIISLTTLILLPISNSHSANKYGHSLSPTLAQKAVAAPKQPAHPSAFSKKPKKNSATNTNTSTKRVSRANTTSKRPINHTSQMKRIPITPPQKQLTITQNHRHSGDIQRKGITTKPQQAKKQTSKAQSSYKKSGGYRYKVRGKHYQVLKSSNGYHTKGTASWYGKPFHGRKTASGETYDMYKLSAAHKTLPLHSIVTVKNLSNGKKIDVRINDRGPFIENREIDLSYGAAKKLGIVERGLAKVEIKAIG